MAKCPIKELFLFLFLTFSKIWNTCIFPTATEWGVSLAFWQSWTCELLAHVDFKNLLWNQIGPKCNWNKLWLWLWLYSWISPRYIFLCAGYFSVEKNFCLTALIIPFSFGGTENKSGNRKVEQKIKPTSKIYRANYRKQFTMEFSISSALVI